MVFFFKQKTAYEFRISDWSSDVCSSDLEPGLGGERFIASGRFMKLIEVGQVLRDALPAGHARKVPTKVMPGWMVNLLSLFNPGVRSIKSELGKTRNADAGHAQRRLGWKTRHEEESVIDCARSLIEHGVVTEDGRASCR